ncbi:MAG: hypothetical protein M3445_08265 [Actinomycetota bacterium]|nr:hypothetical protein [Actinomycetota bacterium]
MTACRWNGLSNPRIVIHRHAEECDDPDCAGCLECSEPHCIVCGKVHVEQTNVCPACVGQVRDDLDTISVLHSRMFDEAVHRGVDSEAAMMAGPAADVEAWQHRAMSAHVQRVVPGWHRADCDGWAYAWKGHRSDESMPRSAAQAFRASVDASDAERLSVCRGCLSARGEDNGYLSDEMGDLHPLVVLGTWDMEWREEFDQPTDLRITVRRAADYLTGQLDHAARHHPAFDEMAADVRRCARRLEDVLHDGERDETGAPCLKCRATLRRTIGPQGQRDDWRCPRCRQTYDEQHYRNAMAAAHASLAVERIGGTDWAIASRVASEVGRGERTIRTWMREQTIATLCVIAGRRLMGSVDDARHQHAHRAERYRAS